MPNTALADDANGRTSADQVARRFVRLTKPRLDPAYRLAGLLLGNAADAEDAVQDALTNAWRSFEDLRDDDRFGAWLDRILVNACRDRLRRRQVIRFVPLDGISPEARDPFAGVLANDQILRSITRLPLEERAIVVLHYWADLPLDEVAARLAIPLGTCKSRLHRALQRMRAEIPAEAYR
jgi:RNA polymerase sigma-70 factor (ECF subfamily)